jgi:hypothetical protein
MASESLDIWMVFQVVAATEDAARDALDEHIEKLETENGVGEMTVDMDDIQAVDKPHPELEKGYSQVCEVDMSVANFSDVISIVINYGPTSIDVKGPESVSMDIGEVRESLNSVAQMMHQFLQAGAGGMMISRPKEEGPTQQ